MTDHTGNSVAVTEGSRHGLPNARDRRGPRPGPIAAAEDRRDRNDEVIRLLDEWLADESGYDEETWPLLKEALNRERELVGAPKLFPE